MLKLKLQYFGHLMERADSLEKTLMLGKIEGRRCSGPMCLDEVKFLKRRTICQDSSDSNI